SDGQQPPITVSVGVAVYPTHGTSIEKLLGAADRALYGMKGRGEKKFRMRHVAGCFEFLRGSSEMRFGMGVPKDTVAPRREARIPMEVGVHITGHPALPGTET